MNVTYIKNGCDTTTSNGLTAVLVNHHACNGFSCFPVIRCEGCPADGTEADFKLLVGQPEKWPWYDANDPASEEYLGTYVTMVDGLQSSVATRDVSSSVGGSFMSVCRNEKRELVISGLMFALTERGMSYGRAWEQQRWWKSACSCHDRDVTFRVDCPSDTSTGLVTLTNINAVKGPSYDYFRENRSCCENVTRFEVTLNALDGNFYDQPECVMPASCFDADQALMVPWECDVADETCEPDCCRPCFEDDPLLGVFELDNNCCWCQPLAVTLNCVTLPAVPKGSSVGFDIEIFSGSEGLYNFRALLVEGDCKMEDACVDECTVQALSKHVLGGVEFNALPPNTHLKLDSRSGSVKVFCNGKWVDGRSFVAGIGGLPYKKLLSDHCGKWSLVFEADAYTVSDDAWVSACSVRRRVAV